MSNAENRRLTLEPLHFVIEAYSTVWVDDWFLIQRISWNPSVGCVGGSSGVANVVYVLAHAENNYLAHA